MWDFIVSDLGYVDILLILFFLVGLFAGFIKGFGVQFSKLFSLFVAVGIGLMTFEKVTEAVIGQSLVNQQIVASAVLLISVIVLTFIVRLLFSLVAKVVSFQFVYFVERVLGSLLGGIRLVFYFCFLAYIVLLWPSDFFAPHFGETSYLGKHVKKVIPSYKKLTDYVRDTHLSGQLGSDFQVVLATVEGEESSTEDQTDS